MFEHKSVSPLQWQMTYHPMEVQREAVLDQYGIDFNGGPVIKTFKYATSTGSLV